MGKYTPGPWSFCNFSRGIGPKSEGEDQSFGMIEPIAFVEFDVDSSVQASNARLIAAAPELLEALIEAEKKLVELEHMAGGGDGEVYVEGAILNARAAIAKATG